MIRFDETREDGWESAFLAIYFTFTPIKFIQKETDFGPDF